MHRPYSRLPFAALAAFALSACSAPDATPSDAMDGPAGGKADEARVCEAGRNCLQFRSYEVLFTNPLCALYEYDTPQAMVGGNGVRTAKPKNVYCTREHDSTNSRQRQSSPQARLLDWIGDAGDGDEVFLAYLSFSDEDIANALCDAEDRGAQVTFVLDSMSSKAEQVEACGGEILIRGHQGSIQFQHNKLLMINPRAPGPSDADGEFVRMSFGSGNMSSGTHLHHENWHFVEAPRDSFFVEAHLCLMNALIPPERTDGKTAFKNFMNACRDEIEFEPEDDITPYFIPVRDDGVELTERMVDMIARAETVDIGAHRFSYREMIDALAARLSDVERPFGMRLIADDDLYWLDPIEPSAVAVVGPNSFGERDVMRELRSADQAGRMQERYMETNHALHLLHHNKYLIFEGLDGQPDTLIVGSSNLTGTGFNDNLENMYVTDIPEVVEAFKAQFRLLWDGEGPLPEGLQTPPLATRPDDMPVELLTITDPVDGSGQTPDRGPDPAADCGLRIAEVLYDATGSDEGREWVKLYNSCEEARSLDGMSLGWGGDDYTSGGIDLAGEVPGASCIIVGGAAAEVDVDQTVTFSPTLQNSGAEADGVALFAVGRASVDRDTRPVDAVIYGDANGNGLIDAAGDRGDPNVGDAPAGQSIARVSASQWMVAEPNATACPDF